MLPALTFTPRRIVVPPRRVLLSVLGTTLVVASVISTLVAAPTRPSDEVVSRSLAQRLSMSTWAIAVPMGWLAAPLVDVRNGDNVDLLAVRSGDRPFAVAVAADLHVMSADERVIVFEVDESSASAIATARASGLLLIPLLRSSH
jgi:hypothetical protein